MSATFITIMLCIFIYLLLLLFYLFILFCLFIYFILFYFFFFPLSCNCYVIFHFTIAVKYCCAYTAEK